MTTTIQQGINKVENWIENTLEPAIEKEWLVIKPQVLDLGETLLSQIWQAASIFVTSGGSYPAALASITAQLPADAVAAEHIIAAALSGAIANLQAKADANP